MGDYDPTEPPEGAWNSEPPPQVLDDEDEDDFEPPDCPSWFEAWF